MMDEKIDALTKEMREMRLDMKGMRTDMDGMRTEMRRGFSEVNSRIDRVEKKVDGITTFLVASEKANESLSDRVSQLEHPKKKKDIS